MSAFGNAKLKAEWAKRHLDTLQNEIYKFYGPNGRRIIRKNDLENARHIIRLEVDPPIEIALLAGDFVHNLRSVLDHIIFSLAIIGTGKLPTNRGLQWPVLENPNDKVWRFLKDEGLSDQCITVIKSLQPYHHGDRYKDTIFWTLPFT